MNNREAFEAQRVLINLFERWKGYELPDLNSDNQFDKEWLHREWVAFQAGHKLALASQAQQNEIQWQPIDTAPKDFITVFDGWNGERVTDVFWGHPDYAERGVYDWVKSEYVQGYGNEYQRVANLTHWMPLPPAPEGDKP